MNTTFIKQIIESSKNKELVAEAKRIIEADDLEETKPSDGEDFTFGVGYKKGAFITDPNYNTIYKRRFPLYFEFLKEWNHL